MVHIIRLSIVFICLVGICISSYHAQRGVKILSKIKIESSDFVPFLSITILFVFTSLFLGYVTYYLGKYTLKEWAAKKD